VGFLGIRGGFRDQGAELVRFRCRLCNVGGVGSGSDSSPMDFMFRSEDHLKVTVKPPVERERDQRRTKEISPVQDENVAQP